MSGTKIEWAIAAGWHDKTAAKRIGIPIEVYMSKKADGLKWCTKCKDWHPIERFGIDRSRGDGRCAHCLSTKKVLSHEEKRKRINARYRRYYATKAGELIRSRVYARKRNMDPVSPRTRELVFGQFHEVCAYCGGKATTIDHVIPVKHNGGSHRGNLLPACASCNSSKKTMSLDEFLQRCYKKGMKVSELIAEELCMSEVLGIG